MGELDKSGRHLLLTLNALRIAFCELTCPLRALELGSKPSHKSCPREVPGPATDFSFTTVQYFSSDPYRKGRAGEVGSPLSYCFLTSSITIPPSQEGKANAAFPRKRPFLISGPPSERVATVFGVMIFLPGYTPHPPTPPLSFRSWPPTRPPFRRLALRLVDAPLPPLSFCLPLTPPTSRRAFLRVPLPNLPGWPTFPLGE